MYFYNLNFSSMKNILTIIGLTFLTLGAKAGTYSMVEINPAHGDCQELFTDSAKNIYGAGELKHFAQLNGLLYFVGANSAGNDELWVTDGTQANTHMVKEINPNGGAGIGDLRVLGNRIIFFANETKTDMNPTSDYDLFSTDGTEVGTVKVSDINADINNLLGEQNAGITNGQLIFCTNTKILRTDGTPNGTRDLAAINLQSYVSNNGYCEMNGYVYFIVNNSIWKSNGTVSGTLPVKVLADSLKPWPLMYVDQIKAFDGKLYVVGAKQGEGADLYVFDGTSSGAVTKVINMPAGNTYPGQLSICAGSLWFTASDTINTALYRLSSSNAPALKVMEVNGSVTFGPDKIYALNINSNGFNIVDAHTNAIGSLTLTAKTVSSALGWGGPAAFLVTMGNKIVFQVYDSATSRQQLCISDGTAAGTRIEMPIRTTQPHPFDYILGCGILDIFDFTTYGNKLVVPANFNSAGRELWFYEEAGMVSGIEEQEANDQLTVYPNPAKDILTIQVAEANNATTEVAVQIFDIDGREVANLTTTESKINLSTADMANGSYIVAVNRGAEVLARRKLIVAH